MLSIASRLGATIAPSGFMMPCAPYSGGGPTCWPAALTLGCLLMLPGEPKMAPSYRKTHWGHAVRKTHPSIQEVVLCKKPRMISPTICLTLAFVMA